jgi:CRP-like cAMP-binding protein
MIKAYLVLMKGVVREVTYPIEDRVTIGRSPINVIHLTDPSVSRKHAVIYQVGGENVIEDLGSHNGTFINGEKVQKAALRNGDLIRIGNVVLHYKEEPVPEPAEAVITEELLETAQEVRILSDDLHHVRISTTESVAPDTSRLSRRLSDALSSCVLFSSVDQETLEFLSQNSRLLIFDRGRIIFRQGDRANSLFVILEGLVHIFIHDMEGRELHLAILGEGQFFGEMSFVAKEPRNATVQVLEETLLCEVGFSVLEEVLRRCPSVREVLERFHRERLEVMEAKKKAAGLVERRRYPRLNEAFPLSFSVLSSAGVGAMFKGRVFRSISRDISLGGVRLKIQDRALLALPVGTQLKMELLLPRPWGVMRVLGTVKSVLEGKEGGDIGYIGVEFYELSSANRKKLQQFLQGERD